MSCPLMSLHDPQTFTVNLGTGTGKSFPLNSIASTMTNHNLTNPLIKFSDKVVIKIVCFPLNQSKIYKEIFYGNIDHSYK